MTISPELSLSSAFSPSLLALSSFPLSSLSPSFELSPELFLARAPSLFLLSSLPSSSLLPNSLSLPHGQPNHADCSPPAPLRIARSSPVKGNGRPLPGSAASLDRTWAKQERRQSLLPAVPSHPPATSLPATATGNDNVSSPPLSLELSPKLSLSRLLSSCALSTRRTQNGGLPWVEEGVGGASGGGVQLGGRRMVDDGGRWGVIGREEGRLR